MRHEHIRGVKNTIEVVATVKNTNYSCSGGCCDIRDTCSAYIRYLELPDKLNKTIGSATCMSFDWKGNITYREFIDN